MRTQPTPLESPPENMATTAEGVENELINLAMQRARQRLIDGTASSAEITALLKLGTMQSRLELEKTKKELELMDAKKELLESSKRMEELYTNAINAMREYSMFGGEEEYEDEWE